MPHPSAKVTTPQLIDVLRPVTPRFLPCHQSLLRISFVRAIALRASRLRRTRTKKPYGDNAMASQTESGTIQTTIHRQATGIRVSFSCPAEGYTLDDLDALSVAIEHARRQLSDITPQLAFHTQLARKAAPS